MKNLNKCSFIGRLGKNPEMRYLPDGTATVAFSIACGDDYKKQSGEKVERTEWINLAAFGKLAELIGKYLVKGSKIYAEGKYTTRKWNSDGIDRYMTEIRLESIEMLDSKPSENSGHQTPGQSQGNEPTTRDNFDDFDDGIPF